MKLTPVPIWSVPRSGSSWCAHVFNSSPNVKLAFQPLFSYAFSGAVDATSGRSEFLRLFEDLVSSEDPFVNFGPSLEPIFAVAKGGGSHLVIKETRFLEVSRTLTRLVPESRSIGLIRCPLAVLASWRLAPKEFDRHWSFEEQWWFAGRKNSENAGNAYGYQKWKEVARLHLDLQREFPDRFLILEYRDLVRDPFECYRAMFDWVGLQWTEQTDQLVAASRSGDDGDPYGVFRKSRGTDDGWQEVLSPAVVEAVWKDLQGTELSQFLSVI